MIIRFLFYLTSVCASLIVALDYPDYPEGYYPFEQTPTKNPPRVRRPPYLQSDAVCPGIQETIEVAAQSLQNLCGNLNEGFLPINPLGQKVKGQTYPFDLIRNSTLRFFSKTLPVLKKDETLPRVAKYMNPKLSSGKNSNLDNIQRKKFEVPKSQHYKNRIWKREVTDTTNSSSNFDSHLRTSSGTGFQGRSSRQFYQPSTKKDPTADDQTIGRRAMKMVKKIGRGARSFCNNNWGFLCLIYNYVSGQNNDVYPTSNRREDGFSRNSVKDETLLPMTPCPSAVEYVTPVFARNYQGVWRYVVQIPYEGYFTQTVEITQCLSTKCHYLSGSCLSSPRWVSLLVAEIFYPDALFPIVSQNLQKIRAPSLKHRPPPPHPTSSRQRPRYASSRESLEDTNGNKHCDGSDNIGCFQVRLYYDWFLVPGSCKCWKQDYQAQFALRHRH